MKYLDLGCNHLIRVPSFSENCCSKITNLILRNNDLGGLEGRITASVLCVIVLIDKFLGFKHKFVSGITHCVWWILPIPSHPTQKMEEKD